ncbi:MAG: PIN domain-containing protein [Bacteroidetes bacterium]|nr:PIN domain-containing protein [Bacteroidota bacterium]
MYHLVKKNGHGRICIVSKIFIDTNILIYTLDQKDPAKNKKARELVSRIVSKHQPVISTQVVKEFYVAATTKLKANAFIVKNIIHDFRNFEIVNNDIELIEQAIDISLVTQLTFWDSLIVAAAEKAKCEFLFSEDFNTGQVYRGVKAVNYFTTQPF